MGRILELDKELAQIQKTNNKYHIATTKTREDLVQFLKDESK